MMTIRFALAAGLLALSACPLAAAQTSDDIAAEIRALLAEDPDSGDVQGEALVKVAEAIGSLDDKLDDMADRIARLERATAAPRATASSSPERATAAATPAVSYSRPVSYSVALSSDACGGSTAFASPFSGSACSVPSGAYSAASCGQAGAFSTPYSSGCSYGAKSSGCSMGSRAYSSGCSAAASGGCSYGASSGCSMGSGTQRVGLFRRMFGRQSGC